jgi:hypothetical protein
VRIKPEDAAKRDKAIIASWEKSGQTKPHRQIAREVQCSPAVVGRVLRAHAGPQRAPGAGRPKKSEPIIKEPAQLELPELDPDDPDAVRRLAAPQMREHELAIVEARRNSQEPVARQASQALLAWTKLWQDLAPPPEQQGTVVDEAALAEYEASGLAKLHGYRTRLQEQRVEKIASFDLEAMSAADVLRALGDLPPGPD